MLNLTTKLTLDAETIRAPNLTDRFEKDELDRIGTWVWEGYTKDKQSRAKWERRTEAAMDLAMQIQKDKNFPWPNCSNVAFPLITIAVTQFHARAYPSIINGPELVKYSVVGSDPEGKQKARAERVGTHMSWQIMEQDSDWETQQDRLLINYAVVGTAFKKSYNVGPGRNESDLVMAKDLVIDYYAKSIESCPRKTHVIPLFRNEVYERVKLKTFRDILDETWYKQPTPLPTTTQQNNADNRQGINQPMPDEITPFQFLEQHCDLDLDDDGYAEPYIITVESTNKAVVRIVCRFEQTADIKRNADGDVVSIRALEYFTKYGFIPSADGGIYDTGFGVLLGPLNESSNSLINQLIDAGTMSTTAGGFLGRGAKLRGGVYTFAPFQWQRVDSSGDDLHKSIYPLPVREPSMVLFQLLSLLINYTSRVSGSTDIMVGESVGQNTPAETARQMQAEGMKIYNAIFKRCWTSMKEEFRKLYILNAYFMPDSLSFGLDGVNVTRQDYLGDPTRIRPVADPTTTTQAERLAKAMLLKQAAASTPGYNVMEVERMFLKANDIPNIDLVYDPQKFPPGEDLKIQLKKLDLQGIQMKLAGDAQEWQANLHLEIAQLQSTLEVNRAKVMELEANAAALLAAAQGTQAQQQVEHFKATIEAMKSWNDTLQQQIQQRTKRLELSMKIIDHANAQLEHMNKRVEHETKLVEHKTKIKELENAGTG